MRLYFSNGKNAYLTVSLFRREYPNYRTLCSSTVLKVVSKFVEHGTVQDRLKTNCGRKETVQVPRNVGIIYQKMQQIPTLSIRLKTPSRDRIVMIKCNRRCLGR